jgi:hypothetical protein
MDSSNHLEDPTFYANHTVTYRFTSTFTVAYNQITTPLGLICAFIMELGFTFKIPLYLPPFLCA